MGKHSAWRKTAKKIRRKRIRQARAQDRDKKLAEEQKRLEDSPGYKKCLEEQQFLEQIQAEEEAKQAAQRNSEWLKVEKEAQIQWQELQKKIALAREEKQKQNMKIRAEWEREQKKLLDLKRRKEKELEEARILQEKRDSEILNFLECGGSTPEHLKTELESNPGKTTCPFFKKTGACRFFDGCSRNHVRPGVSKTILITNFYSHYSLVTKENEHGSDGSLEYEKDETYSHYREFFYDVVSEMEKCGKILQFRTCCNHELHLRGNVYVEYSTTREALISYRKFNGRWYGGRQLNVQFCQIDSWKTAICGLFHTNRCPKGSSCNFLHVFVNPHNLYNFLDDHGHRSKKRKADREKSWNSPDRSKWRWSESPEFPRNGFASDDDGGDRERKCEKVYKHKSDKKSNYSRSRSRSGNKESRLIVRSRRKKNPTRDSRSSKK
ncbi:U2 small nuclear ribonucleoprotein auxiliary factor 35 kDa subunit-related protein 2 [Cylas formicarius]|uniref:U2 small nuclear ribonucleoprotein auxiliary factor 35 kDa subunit-related protein 2 n=1 Tax=Cylas formicarius TaxID=197179 RepID=UPI0029589CA5|nr:U2 small nuclear ribonucleoprotein auxiliary factor 35 kDa subunit-related protein 2 [Cylas formicarius]